jgi:imidazolonepropionase-like amidohydrolase
MAQNVVYHRFMRTRAALLPLLLTLCACQPAEDSRDAAIIGAVLIDGAGGPPLSNSVVIVTDGRIREAGRHGEIPVSAGINKIDGSGKVLAPALVDISAARKPSAIHVWPAGLKPGVLEAQCEAARGAGMAVFGHPVTQGDAEALVENGAAVLIGMIRDTEQLDPAFLGRLRDLRIVYAPALSAIPPGAELDRARHNSARLFAAGVPLAVAGGGDTVHECELLVDAGVPPLDVIVAATANGARALGESAERGTIAPGKRADLLLLAANPGEDIHNLRRVARRMTAGEWR